MRRVMLLAIVALNLFRFTPLRADGPLLPNKLQVITVTNAAQVQALATYKTPADPDQILFTDNSDTLYYSAARSIITLHLKTGAQETMDEGGEFGFDISHDNQWLVVNSSGDQGGVSVIDFPAKKSLAEIPCSGGSRRILFSPTNTRLFAVDTETGAGQSYLDFWTIRANLPNGWDEQTIRDCIPDRRLPLISGEQARFSPNGKMLLVGVHLLDMTTLQELATITLPQNLTSGSKYF